MKKLSPKGIKVLKIVHITFAMVWLSSALSMILIALTIVPTTGDLLRMKYETLLTVDNWMVIVSAITTFFVGIVYGVFTNWGFFKHRWLTVKWIVTLAVILYGTFAYHPRLMQNLSIAATKGDAALTDAQLLANDTFMQVSGFFQAGLLFFLVVISVLKPWKKGKK